jgi:hypothetical protein
LSRYFVFWNFWPPIFFPPDFEWQDQFLQRRLELLRPLDDHLGVDPWSKAKQTDTQKQMKICFIYNTALTIYWKTFGGKQGKIKCNIFWRGKVLKNYSK